jgi:hypothetical protein
MADTSLLGDLCVIWYASCALSTDARPMWLTSHEAILLPSIDVHAAQPGPARSRAANAISNGLSAVAREILQPT